MWSQTATVSRDRTAVCVVLSLAHLPGICRAEPTAITRACAPALAFPIGKIPGSRHETSFGGVPHHCERGLLSSTFYEQRGNRRAFRSEGPLRIACR